MNIQTSGHLLMLSGAIHDIAEKSNEEYTKKQLRDISEKIALIVDIERIDTFLNLTKDA